jgi:hemerythrin-like domain-containing protein
MELTKTLVQEHEAIRRAVSVMAVMNSQVELGVVVDRHDVNALLIFFHYFADLCHQAKEESILFPALKQLDQANISADAARLLMDHHEERLLIEETQLALFTDNQQQFMTTARKLINLIYEHIAEEEKLLFPIAESALPVETANQVVMLMEEADARFGYSQRALLISMLAELEHKYKQKAA